MRLPTALALLTTLHCCLSWAAEPAGCDQTGAADCRETVRWGGSFRARGEYWNNFAFRQEADHGFLLTRLLLHADIAITDSARLFLEGKSSLSTYRDLPGGTRTLDVDTLALQRAFLELRLSAANVRTDLLAGRYALEYGRQRLVSPLPWGNTLRAWDGALMRFAPTRWTIDAFYTWFVPVDKYDRNRRNSDEPFMGVYGRFLAVEQRGFDVYWLRRERDSASFNGTTGAERRDTLGTRLFHQTGPWRGEFEIAWQTGHTGACDIDAWMASLEILHFRETGRLQSLSLGLDYASGDNHPGGDIETFSQLYPLGHAYFGYMDVIGRQNVSSVFLRARFRTFGSAVLEVTGLTFSRASTQDALYSAGAAVVRPGDASRERHVGEELDITTVLPLGYADKLLIGYSHFFPGRFVETSGPSLAADFAYVQYSLSF